MNDLTQIFLYIHWLRASLEHMQPASGRNMYPSVRLTHVCVYLRSAELAVAFSQEGSTSF